LTAKALPFPPDDGTKKQVGQYLNISDRQVYRLCQDGILVSYLLGGSRRITWESVKAYRAACLAKGPQFSLGPTTGKRPVGRPPKAPEKPARP
jgi:excisionase family DNA binding protein